MRFGFAAQSADMPFSVEVTESLKDAAAIVGVDLLILDNRYDAAIAVKNAEEFNSKVDHTVPPYNYVSHRMVTRETPN
jgi:ribose transport system substrate-binding protein